MGGYVGPGGGVFVPMRVMCSGVYMELLAPMPQRTRLPHAQQACIPRRSVLGEHKGEGLSRVKCLEPRTAGTAALHDCGAHSALQLAKGSGWQRMTVRPSAVSRHGEQHMDLPRACTCSQVTQQLALHPLVPLPLQADLPHVDDCYMCQKCHTGKPPGRQLLARVGDELDSDGVAAVGVAGSGAGRALLATASAGSSSSDGKEQMYVPPDFKFSIMPTSEEIAAKSAKRNCTECYGCDTQIVPLSGVTNMHGMNVTIETGASSEWLFFAGGQGSPRVCRTDKMQCTVCTKRPVVACGDRMEVRLRVFVRLRHLNREQLPYITDPCVVSPYCSTPTLLTLARTWNVSASRSFATGACRCPSAHHGPLHPGCCFGPL